MEAVLDLPEKNPLRNCTDRLSTNRQGQNCFSRKKGLINISWQSVLPFDFPYLLVCKFEEEKTMFIYYYCYNHSFLSGLQTAKLRKFANSCWQTSKSWQTRAFTRLTRVLSHEAYNTLVQELLLLVFLCCYTLQTKRPADLDNSELRRWIERLHVRRHVRPPFCDVSRKTRELAERSFWLVDIHQHKFANRLHVKYEFAKTKKLVTKLARIETSSICRQQFANVFTDCFCAVHTSLQSRRS